MKRQVLLFSVLVSSFVNAQDTIYSEVLTHPGVDISANAVAPGAEKGCVVAGKNLSGDGFFTGLDSAGNVRWTVSAPFGDMSIHDLIRTSDGNHLAVGNVHDYASSLAIAWSVKFDAQGDTLWTAGVVSAQNNSTGIRRVIETADGSYLFAGNDADNDLTIFQLSSAGALMWSNTLSGTQLAVESVKSAPDGTFYVSGRDLSHLPYAGFVVHLLADGTLDWAKSYDGLVFREMAVMGNALFVASDLPSAYQPALTKLDLSGVAQWAEVYDFGEFNETTDYHIQVLTDSTFALLFGNLYSGYLTVADTNGTIMRSMQPRLSITDMDHTDDGGWVLAGNGPLFGVRALINDNHIGVVKLDSLLNAADCVDEGWNNAETDFTLTESVLSLTSALNDRELVHPAVGWEPSFVNAIPGCVDQLGGLGENGLHAVTVSPNPSEGLFRFGQEVAGPFVLIVSDATGREIVRSEMQQTAFEIDLSEALPGTYFYHMQFSDGSAAAGMLVRVK